LLRIGVGQIAAGVAAFAIGFISYVWLTLDTETATAGSRVAATSVSETIDPELADRPSITAGWLFEDGDQTAHVAEFAFKEPEPLSAHSSFGDRFSFDLASAPSSLLRPSLPAESFDDRFGDLLAANVTAPSATAEPRATAPRVAAGPPMPRPAPKRSSQSGFQLASASDTSVTLAYAPSAPAKGAGSGLKDLKLKDSDPAADNSRTAIYDITSRIVYLPNGRRLEAHSGLGSQMDDPRYVHAKGTGPTPPNVYDLKMREAPFHGDRAIRLIPADESKMHGRDGILAHSYLLGPSGESNGCVSFKDYAAFLDAFERGEINRLVVVERLTDPPSPKTAADWLSNMFKDFFRRS
jgi:hypothetical protein